ncbi:MAG: type IV pilin N-terminal domain-containing protein [Haloarculaceae archaeon]
MSDIWNERGVSEVLGVVLMVSVTVLLAATAASMFFGFQGELSDSAPTMAVDHEFHVEEGSHRLEIEHSGGDRIAADEIRIAVSGAECGGPERGTRFAPAGLGTPVSEVAAGWRVELSRSTVCESGDLDLSRATVAVIWISADGESSQKLSQWRGPAA